MSVFIIIYHLSYTALEQEVAVNTCKTQEFKKQGGNLKSREVHKEYRALESSVCLKIDCGLCTAKPMCMQR